MTNIKLIMDFVKSMRSDAELYLALRTGDVEYIKTEIVSNGNDNDIEKYLKAFVLLDSDQIFEVLLSYTRKYISTEDYARNQYLNDIKNLWNLGLMIKIISSVNPSKYEKKFADRCRDLAKYNGKSYDKESNRFYADIWTLVKDRQEEFVDNFDDILIYKKGNDTNNELIRFILLLLYQQKNRGVTYEVKTVEHILPQSKYATKDYVHNIGNLTILSTEINKSASDKEFDFKFEKYYSNDVFDYNKTLNKYQFDSEPSKAIQNRARDLANDAFSVFKLK